MTAVTTMSVRRFLRVVIPDGEPDWREIALCAEIGGDLWFPERGSSSRQAKAVCAVCPSKAPCLEFALDNEETGYGIWGGMSGRERRAVKRQQQRRAA